MEKMSKKRYQTMMRRLKILRNPMHGIRNDEKTIFVLPSRENHLYRPPELEE
jgi:hypothetical protein